MSDNGPQFTSQVCKEFLRTNGVQHILTAPYHPSSNSAAERFVRAFKEAMHKNKGRSLHDQLMHFLLSYRVTPHATTGVAPCELFMGRHLRVALDLLRPDLESVVAKKQFLQKDNHDGAATLRQFMVGQRVMVRNFREGPKWVPAIVKQKSGPVSYVVQISPTISWRRHLDQMHGCSDSPYWRETVTPLPTDDSSASSEVEKTNEISVVDATVEEGERDNEVAADNQDVTRAEIPEVKDQGPRSYPQRVHRPPDRYGWK